MTAGAGDPLSHLSRHRPPARRLPLKKKGADLGPEDVQDFCRGQISRYKIPQHIAFVESFPMTASGKAQKYKLQELSMELFPGPDRMPA